MEHECYVQTPSPGNFVWVFVGLFARGGGSTAVAVTLDTVADRSRNKMADGVARSPFRLCSRDGKLCCYGDALSTIFLLSCFCALLPTVRFSFLSFMFFLHPGTFTFFVSLSLCGNHLLLSASNYFIVRVLSACVTCTLPHLGILPFFIRAKRVSNCYIPKKTFVLCACCVCSTNLGFSIRSANRIRSKHGIPLSV